MSARAVRLLLVLSLVLLLLPGGFNTAAAAPGDCNGLPDNPDAIGEGLTNMGFETGTFGLHWRVGASVDEANTPVVTTGDEYATPFEGSHMARIGQAGPSAEQPQTIGPNELCQDFVVDEARETFVYNVFTYDAARPPIVSDLTAAEEAAQDEWAGVDGFQLSVRVTDPATGFILGAHEQRSWGRGNGLKSSGWTGITIDLSDHIGETVRLRFSAGGTFDNRYPFWVYLDSGDLGAPPLLAAVATTIGEHTSVLPDPNTGQIQVMVSRSNVRDITIATTVACPDGSTPTSVTLLYSAGGRAYPMTPLVPGSFTYVATIPAGHLGSGGTISAEVVCSGVTYVVQLGFIRLYDPSGIVTDAVTGAPVEGATVMLHKVPGWTPKLFPGDTTAMTCQSNLSKPPGAPWDDPAPVALGVKANPYAGEISPAANPFITNDIGYYGWDVALGCWYVVVEASGYKTLVSPMVGVPPEVTDLDLRLIPEGSFAALHAQLDELIAAGGITDYTADKVRHALVTAEEWLSNPRLFGPALAHLQRAVHLLLWQAEVVDKGKPNQGDPDGLRALAAAIQAFEEALRAAGPRLP